jgi:hypothetical protein
MKSARSPQGRRQNPGLDATSTPTNRSRTALRLPRGRATGSGQPTRRPAMNTVLSAAVGTGQSPDELIRESAWQLGTIDIGGESFDVVFVRMGGPGHEPALDELARKHPPARTIFDSFGRRRSRPAGGLRRPTRRVAAGRVRRRWQPIGRVPAGRHARLGRHGGGKWTTVPVNPCRPSAVLCGGVSG